MTIKNLMVNHIQEILDLDDIRVRVIMENQVVDIEIKNMVIDTEIRNIDDLLIESLTDHLIKNMEKVIKYTYKSLIFHQVFFEFILLKIYLKRL